MDHSSPLWTMLIIGASTGLWLLLLWRADAKGRSTAPSQIIPSMIAIGGIAVIPTLWAHRVNPFTYSQWFGPFLYNTMVAGIAEEATKFIAFIIAARLLRSIRDPQDGITQGAAIGVGFSAVEGVAYGLLFGPEVAVTRSILIGIHALAGAVWGYLWAVAVCENALSSNRDAYRIAVIGLVPVAAIHSLAIAVAEWTPRSPGGLAWNAILLTSVLAVILTARRHHQTRSAYHRYAFSDHKAAIACITRGLARDPGRLALTYRLGIYQLAAGRTGTATRLLHRVASRADGHGADRARAYEGIALMAAGKTQEGEGLLRTASRRLADHDREHLQRDAAAITSDPRLATRVAVATQSPAGRSRHGAVPRRRAAFAA